MGRSSLSRNVASGLWSRRMRRHCPSEIHLTYIGGKQAEKWKHHPNTAAAERERKQEPVSPMTTAQVTSNKGQGIPTAVSPHQQPRDSAVSPREAICLHRKHEPDFPVMGSIFWPSRLRCLANRKAVSFLHNFSPKNL